MDGTTDIEAFSVTHGFLDGCRLLVLEGEVDIATAGMLDEALDACTDGFPVIVDLSALTFIESSGVHVLLKDRKVGRPSAIVRPPASGLARLLDIMEAKKSIPVYDDVSQAVQRLSAATSPTPYKTR